MIHAITGSFDSTFVPLPVGAKSPPPSQPATDQSPPAGLLAWLQGRRTTQAYVQSEAQPAGVRFAGAGASKPVAEELSRIQLALDSLHEWQERRNQERQATLERAWLARNREQYRGKWIALSGDTLLASGMTSKEVFSRVGLRMPVPLVIRIEEEDLPFGGW